LNAKKTKIEEFEREEASTNGRIIVDDVSLKKRE